MYNPIKQMIGIAGRAEVGKDTAAAILVHALEMKTYRFAAPVTQECAARMGIIEHDFLQIPKSKIVLDGLTKRQLMQKVGREFRECNEYFAITYMQHQIDCNEHISHLLNGQLITDVRLPVEAAYVRAKNGFLIHIQNPNAEPAPEDITEQDLLIEQGDYVIKNDSDLLTFENKVRELAIHLHAKLITKAA